MHRTASDDSRNHTNPMTEPQTIGSRLVSSTRHLVVGFVFLSILAIEPVAAQQTGLCEVEKIPGMIEGFFQLTMGIGLIGLAVVWQMDTVVGMFTLDPQQKKDFQNHKRSALKSTVVLVTLGPLYTVAGSVMGLPMAQCVDLIPW